MSLTLAESSQGTRVRDDDVETPCHPLDHCHGGLVVLLVRRDEGDDVHLARVRGGELGELDRGGGLARAGEDDGIGARGEGSDKGEA